MQPGAAHLGQADGGSAGGVERAQRAQAVQRSERRVVDNQQAAAQLLQRFQALERCQRRVAHDLRRHPCRTVVFMHSCCPGGADMQVCPACCDCLIGFPPADSSVSEAASHRLQRLERLGGLAVRPLGKMEPAERSVPMLVSAAMGAPSVCSAGLYARLSPPPMLCAAQEHMNMCLVASARALHAGNVPA